MAFRRVVRIVPSSAIPNSPPTSRDVFVVAEPRPARWGSTAFMTAAVIGAIVEPIPWPMITNTGSISRYGVSTDRREKISRPVPARISPYVIGIREPCLEA